MTKQEFEKLAGYKVSTEDYNSIIEPMYIATVLDKASFIKCINKKRFAVKEERRPALGIMKMGIINKNGYSWTPNGCWHFIKYVAVEGVDIKTGKYIVRDITEDEADELRRIGADLTMSTYYDIYYTQCLDLKRRPIERGKFF